MGEKKKKEKKTKMNKETIRNHCITEKKESDREDGK